MEIYQRHFRERLFRPFLLTACLAGVAACDSGQGGANPGHRDGAVGTGGGAGASGGTSRGGAGASSGGSSGASTGGAGASSGGSSGASSGGSGGSGGANPGKDGGGSGGTGPVQDAGGGDSGAPIFAGASVLQYHKTPGREGVYVDPAFTSARVPTFHRDLNFAPTIDGHVYAQLLFVDGGPKGADRLYAVTENDNVYALDATTGKIVWQRNVGTAVARSSLPCGNIDPVGITGTPIIDLSTRGIYFDAMVGTPNPEMDGGVIVRHLVYGLSIDDGKVLPGWPVDLSATLTFDGVALNSLYQNQRGALAIFNGVLYLAYGGHSGDCGPYHGWVVGVPLATPKSPKGWATAAVRGGSWGANGVASDAFGVYVATGNTGATKMIWSGGEAIVHFSAGPTFDGQSKNYFAPSNWVALDVADLDLGGTGPVLVDSPGSVPSTLAMAFGKNGVVYLLNRRNLGGIGTGNGTTGEGLYSDAFATNHIISAPVVYKTKKAQYVVAKALGTACTSPNDLVALKVVPGSPPSLANAWCATQGGNGAPIVTTPDGTSDFVVWGTGTGMTRPHGFDGDTGAVVFTPKTNDLVHGIRINTTPIVAKGRYYIAGDNGVFSFVLGN